MFKFAFKFDVAEKFFNFVFVFVPQAFPVSFKFLQECSYKSKICRKFTQVTEKVNLVSCVNWSWAFWGETIIGSNWKHFLKQI